MASRRLQDLHPKLRPLAEQHVRECKRAGIDLLIYCTYRSAAEQDQLFEIGRSRPGRPVTNARGGKSKHNFTVGGKPASLAYDCVPLLLGRCQWEDETLYAQVGRIGKSLGLIWGAEFKSIHDTPHFEIDL